MNYSSWSKKEKEELISYWKDYIKDCEKELRSSNPREVISSDPKEIKLLLEYRIKKAKESMKKLKC